MFDMIVKPGAINLERREFEFPQNEREIDALFDWLDGGERVAFISDGTEHSLVALPIGMHRLLDDVTLREVYLPHWELDGFAVEDMPTVQDIIQAAKKDLLLECVRETLSEAPSPSGNPNIEGAVSETKSWLHALKTYDIDSCDAAPFIVMPQATYRMLPDGENMLMAVEARAVSARDLQKGDYEQRDLDAHILWSEILGYKAWFGGTCIRDSYRALAWVVCKLLRQRFVDFGIWLGRQPHAMTTEEIRLLNKSASEDLRTRMSDLANKIVPQEKLETITFKIDEEKLRKFERICHESGLSVQNALHIAILRFIDNPQGFLARCGKPVGARN